MTQAWQSEHSMSLASVIGSGIGTWSKSKLIKKFLLFLELLNLEGAGATGGHLTTGKARDCLRF